MNIVWELIRCIGIRCFCNYGTEKCVDRDSPSFIEDTGGLSMPLEESDNDYDPLSPHQ